LAKIKLEKKFAVILLDAIDEALTTLGKDVKFSVYFHLESKFAVSKQDIPDRIDDFSDALQQLFGQASKPLEILIMKCLNQKVHCNYKWVGPKWLVPELTLVKYVKLVKLAVEDERKIGDVEVLLNEGEKPQQKI
jgi:hypothetical protein